jgi:4,5-DOPA dioxygenase extradiol
VFVTDGQQSGEDAVALGRLGSTLARPIAVVALSGAWTTDLQPVVTAAKPPLSPGYPSPGWPQLAHRVAELTGGVMDRERGVEESLFQPMRNLFPDAAIRTVQVSLPRRAAPGAMVAMGRALAPLRAEGILILGTGGVPTARAQPTVRAFEEWIAARVESLDLSHLVEYRREAPFVPPGAEDRLQPLFVTLGAARPGDRVVPLRDGVNGAAHPLRSFVLSEDRIELGG